MRLKLSRSEFKALFALFKIYIVAVEPTGIEQVMVHETLMCIYKKLYYRDFDVLNKYSLPLTDAEACAFHFFFSRIDLSTLTFEDNLVRTINNLIYQKYS